MFSINTVVIYVFLGEKLQGTVEKIANPIAQPIQFHLVYIWSEIFLV